MVTLLLQCLREPKTFDRNLIVIGAGAGGLVEQAVRENQVVETNFNSTFAMEDDRMRGITVLAILVCLANLSPAADPQKTKSPEPWKTSCVSWTDGLENNNIATLMKDPGVLKELQFKNDQKKDFEALQREFEKTRIGLTDDTGVGFTEDQIQKYTWDNLRAFQNADRDNYMRVLTPAQRQRLQEIYIQVAGAFALVDEAIQDRLNIDPNPGPAHTNIPMR